MPKNHTPITLTTEMLEAAFERRRRADWPADFATAMAHAVLQRLVRVEAWCHCRRQAAAQAHQARRQRLAHTPLLPKGGSLPLFTTAPIALDAKRRAAGERADD